LKYIKVIFKASKQCVLKAQQRIVQKKKLNRETRLGWVWVSSSIIIKIWSNTKNYYQNLIKY